MVPSEVKASLRLCSLLTLDLIGHCKATMMRAAVDRLMGAAVVSKVSLHLHLKAVA
jgi:hypothetical protein